MAPELSNDEARKILARTAYKLQIGDCAKLDAEAHVRLVGRLLELHGTHGFEITAHDVKDVPHQSVLFRINGREMFLDYGVNGYILIKDGSLGRLRSEPPTARLKITCDGLEMVGTERGPETVPGTLAPMRDPVEIIIQAVCDLFVKMKSGETL